MSEKKRLEVDQDSVAYDKMADEERNELASKQEFLATWARQVELSFSSRILEKAREKAYKTQLGYENELTHIIEMADLEAIIEELTK